MTHTESLSYSSLQVDVTWGGYLPELPALSEESSAFVLSQTAASSLKPNFESNQKLFGLDQKAPSWAFFTPPVMLHPSSLRCFHSGRILPMDPEKILDSLSALPQEKEIKIILKCLLQIDELNRISEEIHKNIFKFQKN